jgi:hypothetical protein
MLRSFCLFRYFTSMYCVQNLVCQAAGPYFQIPPCDNDRFSSLPAGSKAHTASVVFLRRISPGFQVFVFLPWECFTYFLTTLLLSQYFAFSTSCMLNSLLSKCTLSHSSLSFIQSKYFYQTCTQWIRLIWISAFLSFHARFRLISRKLLLQTILCPLFNTAHSSDLVRGAVPDP